jgi:hypothetical protein
VRDDRDDAFVRDDDVLMRPRRCAGSIDDGCIGIDGVVRGGAARLATAWRREMPEKARAIARNGRSFIPKAFQWWRFWSMAMLAQPACLRSTK